MQTIEQATKTPESNTRLFGVFFMTARRSVTDPPPDVMKALVETCRDALELTMAGKDKMDFAATGEPAVRRLDRNHFGREVLVKYRTDWSSFVWAFAANYVDRTAVQDERYRGMGQGTWEVAGPAWSEQRAVEVFRQMVERYGTIPWDQPVN